jgi:osmotically inducible lipoprotein OsmB
MTTMKTLILAVTGSALLALAGCGDTTLERTLSGGAMGAATGATVGAVTGPFTAGVGAAIGAGIGAAAGLVVDQKKKGNIDW